MNNFTELERKCITKFFYNVIGRLNKISEQEEMLKMFGESILSDGIEKSLETMFEMFTHKELELDIKDENNFRVFRIEGDTLYNIFSMNEGNMMEDFPIFIKDLNEETQNLFFDWLGIPEEKREHSKSLDKPIAIVPYVANE